MVCRWCSDGVVMVCGDGVVMSGRVIEDKPCDIVDCIGLCINTHIQFQYSTFSFRLRPRGYMTSLSAPHLPLPSMWRTRCSNLLSPDSPIQRLQCLTRPRTMYALFNATCAVHRPPFPRTANPRLFLYPSSPLHDLLL